MKRAEKLTAAIAELEGSGNLAAYAAAEAAKVLVENWRAAIRDGHEDPADLTNDVDDAISHLRDFERQAYKILKAG